MLFIWILPILALCVALVAVFDKSYRDGEFRLTRVGAIAVGIAFLVAGFSIYQNYERRNASVQSGLRNSRILVDLETAKGQRDRLTAQLDSARNARDILQKDLNTANQNILVGTVEITNSVAEARKLNALLEEAASRITELQKSLEITTKQLTKVIDQLDEASDSDKKLSNEISQIGTQVSQLGSSIFGPPGSEHILNLQGAISGVLKIASPNCNYQLLKGADTTDVFTSLSQHVPGQNFVLYVPGQNVVQSFDNVKVIKVNFTRETDVLNCEATYSVAKNGSK